MRHHHFTVLSLIFLSITNEMIQFRPVWCCMKSLGGHIRDVGLLSIGDTKRITFFLTLDAVSCRSLRHEDSQYKTRQFAADVILKDTWNWFCWLCCWMNPAENGCTSRVLVTEHTKFCWLFRVPRTCYSQPRNISLDTKVSPWLQINDGPDLTILEKWATFSGPGFTQIFIPTAQSTYEATSTSPISWFTDLEFKL